MSLSFRSELGIIEFSDAVLRIFKSHRQVSLQSGESGGQLFCRLLGDKVLVERATEPGYDDKRSRYSFWPSRQKEQRDIDLLFTEGLHYIGDWHTHPEDSPSPSREDVQKMQAIFRKSKHHLKGMLLVVVGLSASPSGLWVGVVYDNDVVQVGPVGP